VEHVRKVKAADIAAADRVLKVKAAADIAAAEHVRKVKAADIAAAAEHVRKAKVADIAAAAERVRKAKAADIAAAEHVRKAERAARQLAVLVKALAQAVVLQLPQQAHAADVQAKKDVRIAISTAVLTVVPALPANAKRPTAASMTEETSEALKAKAARTPGRAINRRGRKSTTRRRRLSYAVT
jgi:colicin import membrane protein